MNNQFHIKIDLYSLKTVFRLISLVKLKVWKKMDSNKKQSDGTETKVDRSKVKDDRESRRLAKQAAKQSAKQKSQDKGRNFPNETKTDQTVLEVKEKPKEIVSEPTAKVQKPPSQKAERRREQKQATAPAEPKIADGLSEKLDQLKLGNKSESGPIEKPEKKQLSKAERRAIQEAQRAAKAEKSSTAKVQQSSKKDGSVTTKANVSSDKPKSNRKESPPKDRKVMVTSKPSQHRVKLFNHLYESVSPKDFINSSSIHPAVVRLGAQYSSGIVKGSNARGLAFMNAIKSVVEDYETPSQKEFVRGLEDVIKASGSYLQQCRPLAVSINNAMKFIQWQIRQLPKHEPETEVIIQFVLPFP